MGMSIDFKKPQEAAVLKTPKWIERSVVVTLGLVATALLQRYGDAVFDGIQSALGKRLAVQAIAILIVLLLYFGWLLFRRPRIRSLIYRRGVFWARRDTTPFCPHCFESWSRQVHLTGPFSISEDRERWDCHTCHYGFEVKLNSQESFLIKAHEKVG